MPKKIRKNLFEYLRHLDEKEDFPKIKRYLESPFFRVESRKKVIKLFELLILHPNYYKDQPEISNSLLNKKMGITDVGNIKSNLVKCIEDYLIITRRKSKEHWDTLLLVESLNEKNMHNYVEKYANYELDKLGLKKAFSSEDYFLKYCLEFNKFRALAAKERLDLGVLEDAINTLNSFYLYTNLINLNAHETYFRNIEGRIDISLAYDLVNSIKNYSKSIDLNIYICYLIFKSLNLKDIKKKIDAYSTLKKIVEDEWQKLNPFFRYEIYTSMINIAEDIISYNTENFKEEIFAIHEFWIQKKIHKTHNNIDTNVFIAIVLAACNSNKIMWCRKFINKNKNLISEKEKEQTISLCNAFINFKEKEFTKVLQTLILLDRVDSIYTLHIKKLELKCWYELNDRLQFNNSLDKIRSFFFSNKQFTDKLKDQYRKAINYISKIEKARFPYNPGKLKSIKIDLLRPQKLKERIWVFEKLDELI